MSSEVKVVARQLDIAAGAKDSTELFKNEEAKVFVLKKAVFQASSGALFNVFASLRVGAEDLIEGSKEVTADTAPLTLDFNKQLQSGESITLVYRNADTANPYKLQVILVLEG